MLQQILYPIADIPFGQLAILPRPRPDDWLASDIEAWKTAGIDVVVSLLEDAEVRELGLAMRKHWQLRSGSIFYARRFPIEACPHHRSAS